MAQCPRSPEFAKGRLPTPHEVAVQMFPTPTVDDSSNVSRASGQYQSLTRSVQMLPMSSSPDAAERRLAEGKATLSRVAALFPTPSAANVSNDTTVLCSGDGRTKPNKLGWAVAAAMIPTPPLSLAVRMVPTPTAGDSKSAARANYTDGAMHGGLSLTDYARQDGGVGRMLPTPRTTDVQSGRGAQQINGRWYRPSKALAQGTLIGGANLSDVAEATGHLPMPTAQDASNNGGPSQSARNTPPLNAVVGGQLNADWVELLMGWPSGWTRLPEGTGLATGKRSRGSRKAKPIASPDFAP